MELTQEEAQKAREACETIEKAARAILNYQGDYVNLAAWILESHQTLAFILRDQDAERARTERIRLMLAE